MKKIVARILINEISKIQELVFLILFKNLFFLLCAAISISMQVKHEPAASGG